MFVDSPRTQLGEWHEPAIPAVFAGFAGATMYQDVILISPSEISREGLTSILRNNGFLVIASHQDYAGLRVDSGPEDVIIVVDDTPATDLSHVIEQSKALKPSAIVVVLADRFDLNAMVSCFHAGAQGFIIKSTRAEPMIAALRLAAAGERVLPPDLVDIFDRPTSMAFAPTELGASLADAKLSQREDDVLCCLMAGHPNKVIARKLEVCEATVKVHVKAILRKLSVSNRTQAAIWASSHGYNSGTWAS
ncbi:MAG: LuxR C-terminal-related transcriptional regulator [Novosphingobium sp.]